MTSLVILRTLSIGFLALLLPHSLSSMDLATFTTPAQGQILEQAYGAPNAPLEVIEYTSMGCPHCAQFSKTTFPYVNKNYVASNQVLYRIRDFPLDYLSLQAAILVWAAPGDFLRNREKTFDAFKEISSQGLEGLKIFAIKELGMKPEEVEAALQNSILKNNLLYTRLHAQDTYGVSGTPALVIGGKEVVLGLQTEEQIQQLLSPHLMNPEPAMLSK